MSQQSHVGQNLPPGAVARCISSRYHFWVLLPQGACWNEGQRSWEMDVYQESHVGPEGPWNELAYDCSLHAGSYEILELGDPWEVCPP